MIDGRRAPAARMMLLGFRQRFRKLRFQMIDDTGCQRRRRAAYHRQKLHDDPAYRAQCHDSQQQWREEHPEYMHDYRRVHGRSKAKPPLACSEVLVRLLERVKNNVAVDLTSCRARVWLVSSDEQVKNILAGAKLIVVQGLADDE